MNITNSSQLTGYFLAATIVVLVLIITMQLWPKKDDDTERKNKPESGEEK